MLCLCIAVCVDEKPTGPLVKVQSNNFKEINKYDAIQKLCKRDVKKLIDVINHVIVILILFRGVIFVLHVGKILQYSSYWSSLY